MTRAGWGALAVALVVAGGCDSGDSAARACAELAVARCAVRDRCTNDLGVLVRYGDELTCEVSEALGCQMVLAAPGTGYTPQLVRGCAAALSQQDCNALFNDLSVADCVPPAGTLEIGAPCLFGSQCQSGYCDLPGGVQCGSCAATPAVDASCPNPGDVVAGLACSKVTGVWVPLGAEGSSCDAATPCGAGLTCVGAVPAQQVAGTCLVSVTTADAACDPARATGADCDRNQGLYCTAEAVCAPLGLAPAWGDCGRLLDGTSAICTGGAVCIFPAGSRQGTCVEPDGDNLPCSSDNGPPCLAPARCVADAPGSTAGTCLLPDATACL
jgi:hypothetical protein